MLFRSVSQSRYLDKIKTMGSFIIIDRANLDFRGFCGTVASGVIKVGDEITVLPSHKSSKVKEIVTYDGNLPYAYAQQAITLTLEDEIDISRGDVDVVGDVVDVGGCQTEGPVEDVVVGFVVVQVDVELVVVGVVVVFETVVG